MKIKGFKDGGTFVLTFDGADQKFINKLIGSFRPEMLEPVDAEPIIMEIADPDENEDSTAEPALTPENRIFEKGPLKGMTTAQALGQLEDRAFRILSFYVSSGKLPKDMHKYCASCLNDYVAYRFEDYAGWTGTDVFKHVMKFTDEKVNEFIELFTPLITADMWKAVKSAPEEIAKLNKKQRKTLVALIILRGAKLSQK